MDQAGLSVQRPYTLKSRVVRGAFGGLLTSILANAFLFVGQLIIPRVLSRQGYAEFTVSISFVALLALFADLGITPMLMREFATAEQDAKAGHDRRGELLGTAILLRIALSVAVAAAVLIIAPTIYPSNMVTNMAIVLVSLIISSRLLVVRSVGEAFMRAHGKYHVASSFALIDACAFAILLVLLRTYDLTVTNVLWIYVLCNIPGFLLLAEWIRRWSVREGIRISVDPKVAKRFIAVGAPLSLGTAFLTIHSQADTLLLDRLSSSYEVSSFAAMVRLSSAVLPIPAVLGGVVAPELTKLLRKEDHVRSRKVIDLSLRVLLIAAGAVALFLMPSSTDVANLFLGQKYVTAAPLLKIVGWMLVPIFIASFMSDMAIAAGKFWYVTMYTAYIMLTVVIGDVLLIPHYGAEGAMLSKLIAVSTGCAMLLVLVRKLPFFDATSLVKQTIRIAVAVAIALAIGIAASGFVSAVVLSGILLLSYALSLIGTRVIAISELSEIRAEFGGRLRV